MLRKQSKSLLYGDVSQSSSTSIMVGSMLAISIKGCNVGPPYIFIIVLIVEVLLYVVKSYAQHLSYISYNMLVLAFISK